MHDKKIRNFALSNHSILLVLNETCPYSYSGHCELLCALPGILQHDSFRCHIVYLFLLECNSFYHSKKLINISDFQHLVHFVKFKTWKSQHRVLVRQNYGVIDAASCHRPAKLWGH